MKSKRPLGWSDTHGASRTPTKRCANERERILATLATLKGRPDYDSIRGFADEILNLAAFHSQSGRDEFAKEWQTKLHRALKQIANGGLSVAVIEEAKR